ncbi:LANO_0H16886g1_1 [Lachancea nothofagi CBS 11611]|uniref:Protein DML1 n=1 Tax=Lachancea nothofagi CBS 11611 TaxID=1266666 RepID=A0A1G4KMU8_9SACH|nr:LANO_0H16886g1_1 [Lachancea nothofagi CBS 11611]
MREVISISASHRTNHLLTQFYNGQEQLLQDVDAENEPGVFLNPVVDRISKTVSYTPRALLWDAKCGTGALGTRQYENTHDYYFDPDHNPSEAKQAGVEIVQTHKKIPKSEYQVALDSNGHLPVLSDSNTRYWSDYSKLVFGPSNLNTLNDWYHDVDNPSAPDFQDLHQTYFSSYDVGYQEFKTNYCADFFDDKLHSQLESCDGLQGLNLLSEMDNGWGGFSSCLLENLRDELPKTDVISWGFNKDDALSLNQPIRSTKTKFELICNKIRSTLSIVRDSNLYFPLYSDPSLSLWRSAGCTDLLFDAVNSASSNRDAKKRTSFNHIVGLLTQGETHRNVVSKLDIEELDFSFYSRIPRQKTSGTKTYGQLFISRDPQSTIEETSTIKTYAWQPSDTIPEEYRNKTTYTASLAVTEKPRDVFKNWLNLVSRYFKYDADREELKEELGTLVNTYEEGWYDDDDSGDDL